MSQRNIRTRFAPSPTGELHIGGARTALFCWLFAKSTGGQFILRIEDTDRERSTQESVDAILDSMAWLGLDYDEGPFYQSKRMDRYQEVIEQLLQSNQAYRCTCSSERLNKLREDQRAAGEKPRYDGCCREKNISATQTPHVIRFKNPASGNVTFEDAIRGTISVANSELDDLIIARSDGSPTYNLTVVVDDWDMNITHVIRGDDHINNTPRQINLLQALNAELPIYAHVPMILGADGKRLSKRHAATGVLAYRDQGILPQALLNYLVRLGWSHGDQEIFSTTEMIELFGFNAINRAPATFDPNKLLWCNQQYLVSTPTNEIATQLKPLLAKNGINNTDHPALDQVITELAPRSKTLLELAQQAAYFYQAPNSYAEKAATKHLTDKTLPVLLAAKDKLTAAANWEPSTISAAIHEIAEEQGLKMGKIAQPIRVAITGDTLSPSIDVTLHLVGQTPACERIAQAINYIQQQQQ